MINLLLGLGVAIVLALFFSLHQLLNITPWLGIPLGLLAGGALFIWLGRRVQAELEKIFTRAGELMKKQHFDAAIAVMKEGYKLGPRQSLVKGSIDGQIGVVQYLRKKNEEA